MAHEVFISHSSVDKSAADTVVAVLEARGIRCWIAPRDIPPGTTYSAEIINALSGARILILVYSAATNSSTHVVREVERAADLRKPILPLRLDDVAPSPELAYFISGSQWFDVAGRNLPRALATLPASVSTLLARSATRAGPPVRDNAPHREETRRRSRVVPAAVVIGLILALAAVGVVLWRPGTGSGGSSTRTPTDGDDGVRRRAAQQNLDNLARFRTEKWFTWDAEMSLGFVSRPDYATWLESFRPTHSIAADLSALRVSLQLAPAAHDPRAPGIEWRSVVQLSPTDWTHLKQLQRKVQEEARALAIPEDEVATKFALRD